MKLSTIDVDNDLYENEHCAANVKLGGWWYNDCAEANLNGLYGSVSVHNGIYWVTWQGYTPMKTTSMMIKRHP